MAPHLEAAAERQVLDQLLLREEGGFPPVEGAAALVAALPEGSWAIVTSGDRASVCRRFAAAHLPMSAVQVYGADVERAKPEPDCFALAASRLGVDPARCLVVEDAPAGVRAGKAAGCTVIGLTTTHSDSALQEADLCVATLGEVGELLVSHGLVTDIAIPGQGVRDGRRGPRSVRPAEEFPAGASRRGGRPR